MARSNSITVTNVGRKLETAGAATMTTDPEKATTSILEKDSTQPVRPYKGFRWFLVCVAIYSSAFLYGLDQTIVADIQAAVIGAFGSVEKLGWLGIGFPLGSIATILSLGKAYSIWDIKCLYIASLIMFAAGSALCGGAPNMDALIVGRVLAGAGGAGMYLGVLNILAINTTLLERPTYMGLTGLVWGAGCILGPVIGGAFADSFATWRWVIELHIHHRNNSSLTMTGILYQSLDLCHLRANLRLRPRVFSTTTR
jgi:MFS family permease